MAIRLNFSDATLLYAKGKICEKTSVQLMAIMKHREEGAEREERKISHLYPDGV